MAKTDAWAADFMIEPQPLPPGDFNVRARRVNFGLDIEIAAFFTDNRGNIVTYCNPATFTSDPDHASPFRPTPHLLRAEEAVAQQLMDDLWRIGLRPTEGKTSSEVVAAQAAHMETLKRELAERTAQAQALTQTVTSALSTLIQSQIATALQSKTP